MKTRLARKLENDQQVAVVRNTKIKQKITKAQKQIEQPKQQRTRLTDNQFEQKEQIEPTIKKQSKQEQPQESIFTKGKNQLFEQLKNVMSKQRNVSNKQLHDILGQNSSEQDTKTAYLEELKRECSLEVRLKGIHVNTPEEIVQKYEKLQEYEFEDNQSEVDESTPYQMISNLKALQMFNTLESRRVHTQIPLRTQDYVTLLTSRPLIKDLVISWDFMHYDKQLQNLTDAVQNLQSEYKDFGHRSQGKLIKFEIDLTKHFHGFNKKQRYQRAIAMTHENIAQIRINVFAFRRLRSLTISLYTCQMSDTLSNELLDFISNVSEQLICLETFRFTCPTAFPQILQALEAFETNEEKCHERSDMVNYICVEFTGSTKFERRKIPQSEWQEDWTKNFEYSIFKTVEAKNECHAFYLKRASSIVELKYMQVHTAASDSTDILNIIQSCRRLKVLHLRCGTKKIQEVYPEFYRFNELREVQIAMNVSSESKSESKKDKVKEKINNEVLERHIRNLYHFVAQKDLIYKFTLSHNSEPTHSHSLEINRQQNFMSFEMTQVQQSYLATLAKLFALVVGDMHIKSYTIKAHVFMDDHAHSQFFEMLSDMMTVASTKIDLVLTYFHPSLADETNERILSFFRRVGTHCELFSLDAVQFSAPVIQRVLTSWIRTLVQVKGPDRITLTLGSKVWTTLPYHKLSGYLRECVNAQTELNLYFDYNFFGGFQQNNPQEQYIRWKELYMDQIHKKRMIRQQRVAKIILDWRHGAIADFVQEVNKSQVNAKPIPMQFLDSVLCSYFE